MKNRALAQWTEKRFAEQPLRAKSLIVTLFGDMIAPRGGSVGLAGFIRLVEPLGLNDRLVRTSVFRLSREKWLDSQQVGRRSYYTVTATGRRRFDLGAQRFYADPRQPWDGAWRLVFLPNEALPPRERDALRRRLLWEGFAAIAPGVLAHPSAESDGLFETLQEASAHDRVVVMSARSLGALSARPLKELVDQCWNLGAVADEYRAFVDLFRPVAQELRAAAALDPEQCFVLRALLMHEFRRVQLRDPLLPRQLEPSNWPGDAARDLCREIYALCWNASEARLTMLLDTADGPLPAATDGLQARFAGVEAAGARTAA